MRLEWLTLRMKVLCEHAFFKKLLLFQEKIIAALIKRSKDQILDLAIQVAESTSSMASLLPPNDHLLSEHLKSLD